MQSLKATRASQTAFFVQTIHLQKGAAELRSRIFIWPFAMAAIGIGCFCYKYMLGPFRPELSRARYLDIRTAVSAAPSAVVVFGDSIFLAAPIPDTACGTPIVNAGVGVPAFSTLSDSDELLGSSTPKLIVLAVGVNDAHADTSQKFRTRYLAVVKKLTRRAPVVLATLAPVQPGSMARLFDAELIPSLNAAIKEMSEVVAVIDLHGSMNEENLTTDGIHLNSREYDMWIKVMMEGIDSALGCKV